MGHHESSMYMDLCLQMGRWLRGAGMSRWGDWDKMLTQDFTVVLEVFVLENRTRLLSETGAPTLWITDEVDGGDLWSICIGHEEMGHKIKRWDVAEALGVEVEETTSRDIEDLFIHQSLLYFPNVRTLHP